MHRKCETSECLCDLFITIIPHCPCRTLICKTIYHRRKIANQGLTPLARIPFLFHSRLRRPCVRDEGTESDELPSGEELVPSVQSVHVNCEGRTAYLTTRTPRYGLRRQSERDLSENGLQGGFGL
jgi:hypothetical protein